MHNVESVENILTDQVQKVSRSFAFVIDQLPEPLRREVQVAYLLFRLGDNIEDTASLSPDEKSHLLSALLQAFAAGQPFSAELQARQSDLWTDLTEGEHELMRLCDPIITAFSELDPSAKASLLEQADIMFKGMAEIQRDHRKDGFVTLPDQGALDRYCYYVAGTVGDFLTDRFLTTMPNLPVHRRAQMLGAGRALALVLQVTNILRDIRDDHEHGHIFYPRALFSDFSAPDLLNENRRIQVLEAGRKMATWLLPSVRLASAFILGIPRHQAALRLFAIIPYAMAIQTLTMSVLNPALFEPRPVKMTRSQTKQTVAIAKMACRSDLGLRLWFEHLIHELERKIESPASINGRPDAPRSGVIHRPTLQPDPHHD
ncbi:MAG: squalene/phytoene synthase family protein [Deltaproteobacteria bacterium]|nr:squalene/phytoene synthase family protein [Deltaproteobacteria bacterium]